jgi:hypothetical protein
MEELHRVACVKVVCRALPEGKPQPALAGSGMMQLLLDVKVLSVGGVAALGQALIPYYTGQIIDYASIDQRFNDFQRTCLLLVGVAFGTAVFTGVLSSPLAYDMAPN